MTEGQECSNPEVILVEPAIKPGYLTTEFWLAIGGLVAGVGGAFGFDAEWLKAVSIGLGNTVVAVYGLWRTIVKKNAKIVL